MDVCHTRVGPSTPLIHSSSSSVLTLRGISRHYNPYLQTTQGYRYQKSYIVDKIKKSIFLTPHHTSFSPPLIHPSLHSSLHSFIHPSIHPSIPSHPSIHPSLHSDYKAKRF